MGRSFPAFTIGCVHNSHRNPIFDYGIMLFYDGSTTEKGMEYT